MLWVIEIRKEMIELILVTIMMMKMLLLLLTSMMMMIARASLSSPVILRVGHFPGAEKPLTENHLSLPFTPSNPPSICFCHIQHFHISHFIPHTFRFSYFHISRMLSNTFHNSARCDAITLYKSSLSFIDISIRQRKWLDLMLSNLSYVAMIS